MKRIVSMLAYCEDVGYPDIIHDIETGEVGAYVRDDAHHNMSGERNVNYPSGRTLRKDTKSYSDIIEFYFDDGSTKLSKEALTDHRKRLLEFDTGSGKSLMSQSARASVKHYYTYLGDEIPSIACISDNIRVLACLGLVHLTLDITKWDPEYLEEVQKLFTIWGFYVHVDECDVTITWAD